MTRIIKNADQHFKSLNNRIDKFVKITFQFKAIQDAPTPGRNLIALKKIRGLGIRRIESETNCSIRCKCGEHGIKRMTRKTDFDANNHAK